MTDVLQLLQSHRSIRRFRTDPLPDGLLTEIVRCGQQAASSSNLQAYRILRITDPALRARFSTALRRAGRGKTASLLFSLLFCRNARESRR